MGSDLFIRKPVENPSQNLHLANGQRAGNLRTPGIKAAAGIGGLDDPAVKEDFSNGDTMDCFQ